MYKKILILLVVFLIAGIVFAETEASASPFLQARYKKLNCEVEFAKTIANNLKAIDSNSSAIFDEKVNSVTISMNDFNQRINKIDQKEFNSKMAGVLEKVRSISQISVRTLNDVNRLGTQSKLRIAESKTQRENARQEFIACMKNAQLDFLRSKIDEYKRVLSAWENRIREMQDKKINAREMNQIMEQARERVMIPLEQALMSNDANAIGESVRTTCLHDGCESGDFHFAAKMEAAKLQALIEKIEPTYYQLFPQNSAQQASLIEEAKVALANVKSKIAELDGKKYDKEERDELWRNLKNCALKLKEAVKLMKEKNNGGNVQ